MTEYGKINRDLDRRAAVGLAQYILSCCMQGNANLSGVMMLSRAIWHLGCETEPLPKY